MNSYPTPTFLDFQLQGVQMTFPGMDEVRLNVGYRWETETRSIGEPVISLPHGDEVIWVQTLDEVEADVVDPFARDDREPATPIVELVEDVDGEVGDEED